MQFFCEFCIRTVDLCDIFITLYDWFTHISHETNWNDVTLAQGDYQGQGHILYLVQLYTVEANKSINFTIFWSVLYGLQYIYTKNIVIIMAYQCYPYLPWGEKVKGQGQI